MKAEAYDLMEQTEDSYWWYRARREIIGATMARVLPRGSHIIDYGCGTGGTSVALRDLGYTVVAADISEDSLRACRQKGLVTINLTREELAENSADCVMAGDVLEHLHDDVAALSQLRRALRPGGLVFATVPAFEFLWSGEDYVSDHVRRYTRSILKQHFRMAGYRAIECSYFNLLLFPVIVAVTLGRRIFVPRAMYRSDVETLPEWQNEILYKIFAFERHLLKWLTLPVGASLLIVAQATTREHSDE